MLSTRLISIHSHELLGPVRSLGYSGLGWDAVGPLSGFLLLLSWYGRWCVGRSSVDATQRQEKKTFILRSLDLVVLLIISSTRKRFGAERIRVEWKSREE